MKNRIVCNTCVTVNERPDPKINILPNWYLQILINKIYSRSKYEQANKQKLLLLENVH